LSLDGILVVNKPPAWTSFDVVAFVRRRSGVKRVGHAGTLDPAAEGVLVVCLGQATRVAENLLDARKTYRACIRLGIETDTYDADGEIVRTSDPSSITQKAVEQALQSFRGVIEQRPPLFSALKRDGVPLYRHARAGREVEIEARPVEVYRIDMLEFDNPSVTVDVECGRGFYVRSLAHDLGERLSCGAHLQRLTRTSVGRFRLEAAVDIEALRRKFEDGTWRHLILPLDEVLLDWRAAIVGAENAGNARSGRPLNLTPVTEARSFEAGTSCRAYSLDGRLIALLDYVGNAIWQPTKVFEGTDSPV
jgi:tRNA pseudouridine55 synthase